MKSKILILTDWFLPGTNAGGPVRSIANLTDHLGDEFHFQIITRNSDYCADASYKDTIPNQWNKLTDKTQVYYISEEHLNISLLKKLIKTTQFDVLYINGIYSWWFSILPLILIKNKSKKVIVAPRGMLNPQAFSSKKIKKNLFLLFANIFGLYKHVVFQANNDEEAKYIEKRIKNFREIKVVPNLPRKFTPNLFQSRNKVAGSVDLISMARISPEKGTLHALKFLSKIQGHSIRFKLYGSVYDEAYWNTCKKLIETLPKNIEVNYEGPVEGDRIFEVLSKTHFLLMPSEGENFGHSIIEALSTGCPVIISDQTPWRNLEEKKAGWDISLEETDQFVYAIKLTAAMDQETYNTWSESAFDYAQEYYKQHLKVEEYISLFR